MTTETHWRGRPLSDLSREELYDVINELGAQATIIRDTHKKEMEVLERLNSFRRYVWSK